MQLPQTLQLKPSRCFLMLLAGGHALAGVAVLLAPLPWFARLGLIACLGLLLLRSGRHAARKVSVLILGSDGKLAACLVDGTEITAHVLPATIVWPWLVIVRMRELPALVVFPDGLEGADAHRQLRIWLKWCPSQS